MLRHACLGLSEGGIAEVSRKLPNALTERGHRREKEGSQASG